MQAAEPVLVELERPAVKVVVETLELQVARTQAAVVVEMLSLVVAES
jgi:hypothetical protein